MYKPTEEGSVKIRSTVYNGNSLRGTLKAFELPLQTKRKHDRQIM